jgi:acyl-CoA thioester hydrolase
MDTDATGRIHYTAVFRWVEATEIALLRSLELLGPDTADHPRRHIEAEYLKVLSFDDKIEVSLTPARVGETSITYAWEILLEGATAVKGGHTLVHVDAHGRPAPISREMRTAFLLFLEEP